MLPFVVIPKRVLQRDLNGVVLAGIHDLIARTASWHGDDVTGRTSLCPSCRRSLGSVCWRDAATSPLRTRHERVGVETGEASRGDRDGQRSGAATQLGSLGLDDLVQPVELDRDVGREERILNTADGSLAGQCHFCVALAVDDEGRGGRLAFADGRKCALGRGHGGANRRVEHVPEMFVLDEGGSLDDDGSGVGDLCDAAAADEEGRCRCGSAGVLDSDRRAAARPTRRQRRLF